MYQFEPGYWREMPFREFIAWQRRADRQMLAERNAQLAAARDAEGQ